MDGDTFKLKVDFTELDKAVAGGIKAFEKMAVAGIDGFHAISDVVTQVMTTDVGQAFNNVVKDSVAAFNKVAAAAISPLTKIKNAFASVFGGLAGPIKALVAPFSLLLAPVKMVFGAISSTVKGVFSGITSTVKTVFSKILGTIQGVYSRVKGIIQELLPYVGIGIFAGLIVGFNEFIKTEQALTQVTTKVKSTGMAAGFTAKQLRAMADEMAEVTRFGDDAVLAAQNAVLSFTNIRGDEFVKTMQLIADAAAESGSTMEAEAEGIARALNDPEAAAAKLAKRGRILSYEQKQLLSNLIETGQGAKAQSILLEELAAVYGGQAAADAQTFGGQVAMANNALGDMWKAISGSLIPIMKPLVQWFKDGAKAVQAWKPQLDALVDTFKTWATDTIAVLNKWWEKAKDIAMRVGEAIIDSMSTAFAFIKSGFENFGATFEFVKTQALVAFDAVKNQALDLFDGVAERAKSLWQQIMEAFDARFGESMDRMLANFQKTAVNMNKFNPVAHLMGFEAMTDADVEEQVRVKKEARELEKRRQAERGSKKEFEHGNQDPNDPLNQIMTTQQAFEAMKQRGDAGATMQRAEVEAQEENERRRLARLRRDQEARKRGEDPANRPRRDPMQEAADAAMEARIAKTKELEEAAKKAAEEFAKIFNPNKEQADKFAEDMKRRLREALGRGPADDGDSGYNPRNPPPMQFKENAGKTAQYEDLTALQKRIQGAAAGRSPELTALQSIDKNVKKQEALAQKEAERQERINKRDERRMAIAEEMLRIEKANAGQGALIG